jgi:hypothetical protein
MTMPQEPIHLTDEDLAAWLDGTLTGAARTRAEQHLIACDECRNVVVQAGGTLVSRKRTRAWPWAGVGLAAAAALVILVVSRGPTSFTTTDSLERAHAPVTEDVPRFEARAPETRSAIARDSLAFAWEGEPEGTVYQLTISDERGGVVFTTRTTDSTFVLPRDSATALVRGQVYYWLVEALLPDLRSATTAVRSFTVR